MVSAKRKPRLSFIGETIAELKKVIWPPRRETTRLTVIVIIVAVAMGIILATVDFGFSRLMDVVLLR